MTEVIQRRPNSCTSDSSSNNSNRNSTPYPSNQRKSHTATSSSSSSHCTVTVKYILFLTLILLGITIQHQWEHSISSSSSSTTTSTTKLKTTSIQSTIAAAAAQPSSNPLQQQQLPQTKKNPDTNQHRATTIAYVVTITSCEGHERDNTFQIVEGASVLRHSIHMNSIRSQNSNINTSSSTSSIYDYQLYAFYHPDAVACAIPLLEFGYIIEARPTPVQVADIQNPLLRERIVKNGCCGEKELIKLEAFTLTSYPLVVLLDIDTLILQPLDRLFQFMLLAPSKEEKDHPPTRPQRTTIPLDDDDLLYYPNKPALGGRNTNVTIDFHSSSSSSIDFLYTTDYAMVNADRYIKPVQGGFVILRPNRTIYNDFIHIVQVGDFQFEGNTDLGWGGRTGRFWGGTYLFSL